MNGRAAVRSFVLKKALFAFGSLLVLFVLLVSGFLIYNAILQGKRSAELKATDSCLQRASFDYLQRSDSVPLYGFTLPTTGDIRVHAWTMNLWGSVDLAIADESGRTVFRQKAGMSEEGYRLRLSRGSYSVTAVFHNVFFVAGIFGIDTFGEYLLGLPVAIDTDGDGLPDESEKGLGTSPEKIDSDNDSIPDYEEVVKYRTNPVKADSDADGIPNGDANEKREYAYTVRIEMLIRGPFDLRAMNDQFQDARLVKGPDGRGYSRIEAIIYPDTQDLMTAAAYPLTAVPKEARAYLEPGIATNFDSEMQAEVEMIAAGGRTDAQVVHRILEWVRTNTDTYVKDRSIPEVYFTYRDGGKIGVRNYTDSMPAPDLLRTHYFAASMFAARTHGTCTSIATLKCAMLRAAGIPCRLIQTIAPIYSIQGQNIPYVDKLERGWDRAREGRAKENADWVNHAFLEVFLGKRWVRVDESAGIYMEMPKFLGLKILSLADWSDVDFSLTYPVDWVDSRPYYTLLVEDKEPRYTSP